MVTSTVTVREDAAVAPPVLRLAKEFLVLHPRPTRHRLKRVRRSRSHKPQKITNRSRLLKTGTSKRPIISHRNRRLLRTKPMLLKRLL
jgi:hypothetical protein